MCLLVLATVTTDYRSLAGPVYARIEAEKMFSFFIPA